jgi:hypothetical protein
MAPEDGDAGVGEQVGREPAVDGCGDRPDRLADDEDSAAWGQCSAR